MTSSDCSRRLKPSLASNLTIRILLPQALRVHQLLMGETPKTALAHHLPRYIAATMHPRQYDYLTVNFFPRKSFGTSVLEKNTHTSNCAWNFTDATLASNPFPNFQGASYCTNLQQFLARFLALENIVQRLKPLLYKDFVSGLSTYDR
ncbi:MAG: hypothetical protein QNJ41_28865 [Xenococcaceae cyanobacterium MO_188.B32]|nr:hypothetical protein [Xenococcaceae cyanobacterium MO_188.B32]